jgi:hypothetical protein
MMLGRWKKAFPATAVLLCAAVVGLAMWAAIGSSASGHAGAAASHHAADAACLKRPLRAMIGHSGPMEPRRWRIVGLLRNDARCHSRMLDFNFWPFVGSGPNWTYGEQVGAAGSLSPSFVIASRYLEGTNEVAFGGITGRRSAVVEYQTHDGAWSKVTPEDPRASVIARAGWLRNVRYFLQFLPAHAKVQRVRVRDRAGNVLYEGREALGAFDDSGFP